MTSYFYKRTYLPLALLCLLAVSCQHNKPKAINSQDLPTSSPVSDSQSTEVDYQDTLPLVNPPRLSDKANEEKKKYNKRYQDYTRRNDKYTPTIAKKLFGEGFMSKHRITTWPLNNPYAMIDKKDVIWITEARDTATRIPVALFSYDNYDSVLFNIDITKRNPYYRYINSKYKKHPVVTAQGFFNPETDVEKAPKLIQDFIRSQERNFPTNINTQIGWQNMEFIKLNHYFGLHPGGEIIEFIPFAGLTTLELFDLGGNLLASLKDLPFKVEEWHISSDGTVALMEHWAPIDGAFSPAEFEHYFSLYNLKTGKLCFRESNKEYRYSTGEPIGKNGGNPTEHVDCIKVNKEDYINRDSTFWTHYNILSGQEIAVFTVLNSGRISGHTFENISRDGIFYKNNKDGSLLNAKDLFNFRLIKTDCHD